MQGMIAFLFTVFAAILLQWEAKDLIWGLWISSLCVGYAYIVRIVVINIMQAAKTMPIIGALIGGLGFWAFFTFHFGFFHVIHSVFLSLFFPLIPMDRTNFPDVGTYFMICVSHYWPVIVGTLLMRLPDILGPVGESKTMRIQMGVPYVSVVKIHILIFVFAGMSALHLNRFAMYPILLFFFFPFDLFFAKKKGEAD